MGFRDQHPMRRARTSIELFLGLSTAAGVLVGSLSAPVAVAQHHHPTAEQMNQGGEGGEGGEGQANLTVNSNVDFLVILGQMQGHLRVAQELLKAGEFRAAEPHVGHPVDELYGAIAPALKSRDVPSFLSTLEDLRQQVRIDPGSELTFVKLNAAQQAIANAENSVPLAIRTNFKTVNEVARKLAEVAVAEYSAAEGNGQIVEVIEYQDARGFLQQADQTLAWSDSTSVDPAQVKRLKAGLQVMLRAFPSVMPPIKAVLSASQLESLEQAL